MQKFLSIGLIVIALFQSCKTREGFQAKNVAYLYDPSNLSLKNHLVVEHISDEVSRLHYRLNSSDLLYVRNNQEDLYEAKFEISFKLVPSIENTLLLDSNTFSFSDKVQIPPSKTISGYFDFKTTRLGKDNEKNYLLFVQFKDINRNTTFENFKHINKDSKNSRQFFVLKDVEGNILYKPHLPINTPFKLENANAEADRYFVSLYDREFPLALPPYSSKQTRSFKLDPDTTYVVDANEVFTLKQKGFYHIRLDTNQWEGYTIYSFNREFPYIGKTEQMAEPLRYLTLKKEFDSFLEAKDDQKKLKSWVDEFWLNRSGSTERSRYLVASYYKRVEEANKRFTSYIEGWKTDRGIVYTIYGPPNKVFRSSGGESWVYGNETSSLSYVFNFIRVKNPFTDNDFQLNRMPQYRYGWGQAIEAWRNGHIYNSKDIRLEQDAQDQLQYRRQSPLWY